MNDAIKPRTYYAARKNGSTSAGLSLDDLREVVYAAFEFYDNSGYFVEAFGFTCVDAGFEPGYAGTNIDAYLRTTLQCGKLWPLSETYTTLDEDVTFSLIEFLYDHISKPLQRDFHSWDNCGYHYSDFDRIQGREEFRHRVNLALRRYGQGWELSQGGEILSLPPEGMATLLTAKAPTTDLTTAQKLEAATKKYRQRGSTVEERADAVRDLADVLEWLRPEIKDTLLKEDERELFNIANNFGIRHMNQNQKMKYDRNVWLSWMFYHYLNTIHAFLHLLRRQRKSD